MWESFDYTHASTQKNTKKIICSSGQNNIWIPGGLGSHNELTNCKKLYNNSPDLSFLTKTRECNKSNNKPGRRHFSDFRPGFLFCEFWQSSSLDQWAGRKNFELFFKKSAQHRAVYDPTISYVWMHHVGSLKRAKVLLTSKVGVVTHIWPLDNMKFVSKIIKTSPKWWKFMYRSCVWDVYTV